MLALRALVASLTIGIACLLPPFASQRALAEEPIQRAFGQTLGAVFDPTISTRSSGETESVIFWYPDPAKIRELTEFKVELTPVTYRSTPYSTLTPTRRK